MNSRLKTLSRSTWMVQNKGMIFRSFWNIQNSILTWLLLSFTVNCVPCSLVQCKVLKSKHFNIFAGRLHGMERKSRSKSNWIKLSLVKFVRELRRFWSTYEPLIFHCESSVSFLAELFLISTVVSNRYIKITLILTFSFKWQFVHCLLYIRLSAISLIHYDLLRNGS